jgi:hypothetical protein
MAKIGNSILGPIQGKVGNVIAATWKGIPYVRIKPLPPRKKRKPSAKEALTREKFKVAQYWLKPVLKFVREGFKGYTTTVEGFIAAKSYLMKNAMEVTDDKITIDPSKVLVSYGDLALPEDLRVERTKPDELTFSWDKKIEVRGIAFDQCMLLAYNIEKKNAVMKTSGGQFRYVGSDTLPVYAGLQYHVYIAFIAEDRNKRSMSVYLGVV